MDYEVICPYCGKNAEYIDSRIVYGKSYGMIYLCRDCGAYVGCHRSSKRPLGRLADAELRKWKQRAHSCFDWLWKGRHMSRGAAYRWLAEQMNLDTKEAHIGLFDVKQCKQVIKLAQHFLIEQRK